MRAIAPYQLDEQLYESATSVVYRGQRTQDSASVILKLLKPVYPPPQTIAWFQREYALTHSLDLDGVIAVHSLECDQQQWVMVMEDFGGESLARLHVAGRLALLDFLTLAIQITQILGRVHQRQVIHKDINPSNIVFNPQTGQVKLIDFGISTRLARETPTFRNPEVLEGTLTYLSPEQTGRMNRAIDYRSDFYSLGATFYEFLTGQAPFPTRDVLELVHAHIAKYPRTPHELKPEIPQVVSAIVLKLLAKNAEDRYQSAHGLQANLEECRHQWQTSGRIELFPLGQHDVADRLQLPQKLYGREREIETIAAALERASQGAGELLLVAGASGIGKTALMQEVYKPLTRQRGYFLAGKFDQFQRNIPYAALSVAFRGLMRQLLTESDAAIAVWREQLLAALGPNGQVIVELTPEVELLIGLQPDIPTLGPIETQNRFNLVFHNFLRVFATPEHPLVLFLDDLQWADAASLHLLRSLLTTAERQCLLVIGAYRDSEVTAGHPLLLMVNEIAQAGAIVHGLALAPLDLPAVTNLLAETLRCSLERARGLAGLLLVKTGGNPFFLGEFLKSLYARHLLIFGDWRLEIGDWNGSPNKDDSQSKIQNPKPKIGWQWDLAQIQAQAVTDNVVELLAGRVQQLPPATRRIVQLAACIGHRFDLATLALVVQQPPHVAAADLWAALAAALVVPLSDAYKVIDLKVEGLAEALLVEYQFAHDRVQQAVYSLIAKEQKPQLHLAIGRLLLAQAGPATREERLFDIVNQLNSGLGLIIDPDERAQLAELNLRAGQKARTSTAYAAAATYYASGIELLGADCWERQYGLAFALHKGQAECAYLSGESEQAEALFETLLTYARSRLDRAEVYNLRVVLYTNLGRFAEAVATGCTGLQLFGLVFPESTAERHAAVGAAFAEAQHLCNQRSIDELLHAPLLTDPERVANMTLLMKLCPPSYFVSQELFILVVMHMVHISLREGHTAISSFAYVMYAQILGSVLEQYQDAYAFGTFALKLNEAFKTIDLAARLYYLFAAGSAYWHEPLSSCITYCRQAYQIGLATGDFIHAGYAGSQIIARRLSQGDPLQEVSDELDIYLAFVQRTNDALVIARLTISKQFILSLQSQTRTPESFDNATFQSDQFLERLRQAGFTIAINWYFTKRLQQLFLLAMYPEALCMARETDQTAAAAAGQYELTELVLYTALTLTALYSDATADEQSHYDAELERHQARLKTWAELCPANFLHNYELVTAERARLAGDLLAVMDAYDRAIAAAREYACTTIEAIANDLAARFYLGCSKPHLARHYLAQAHYGYHRCGATALTQRLEREHPELRGGSLLGDAAATTLRTQTSSTTTNQRSSAQLDLLTVMKAAQAISSEITLDALLTTLLQIAIENAGAQRGCLVLDRAGALILAAIRTVDQDTATTKLSVPLEEGQDLATTVVHYVARTREAVVVDDASGPNPFAHDPYITAHQPRSICCLPLLHQSQLSGVLYLENNLATEAFTPARLEVLGLLATQAAIALENAGLYADVQQENAERKRAEDALRTLNAELEQRVTDRTADLAASTARLRLLLEQMPAVLWTTSPDLQFTSAAGAGLTSLQVQPHQLVGMSAYTYFQTDNSAFQPITAAHRALAGEAVSFEITWQDRTFQAHVEPFVDAQGQISGTIGIALDITERTVAEREREQLIGQLQEALANIKTLRGLVPICAACKKIRDDTGYWNQLESYLLSHTEAEFSHGICPDCVRRLYPDLADEMNLA